MLAIYIDSIGDKSATYKLLRNFHPATFLNSIQNKIHDSVMDVDILDLDELKKVRVLIHDLSGIGTMVTMKDSTGVITLKILNNIITTYEEIAAERE